MTDNPDLKVIEPEPLDPFDPEALRLSQDFAALANVKPILATVPVRKPGRQDYFRVHSSEDYQLTTAIIELKEERGELYLVASVLSDEVIGEVIPVAVCLAVNRGGVGVLWRC